MKHREFWIEEWLEGKWHSSTCWQFFKPRGVDSIHVIEASALTEAQQEIEQLKRDYGTCDSERYTLKAINKNLSLFIEQPKEGVTQTNDGITVAHVDWPPRKELCDEIDRLANMMRAKDARIAVLTEALKEANSYAEKGLAIPAMRVLDKALKENE